MNNFKLTRDINNIINNYLDYSSKKLNKILNISNQIKVNLKLKKNITIEDIIFICAKLGYKGFYIDSDYNDIITEIDKLLSPYNWYEEFDVYNLIEYNINGIFMVEHLFACENNYIIGTEWIDESQQINFMRLNLCE